jgi:rRNA maturation RNase YbeY
VTKARMIQINEQFRKRRRATDGLSFPYALPHERPYGEIIICPEVIARRTLGTKFKINPLVFSIRICKMLIHSVCHLNGHDHHTSSDIVKVSR